MQKEHKIITYSFRIKDPALRVYFNKLAQTVNFVWNYCNETGYNAIRNYGKWLSAYDFNPLIKGTAIAKQFKA